MDLRICTFNKFLILLAGGVGAPHRTTAGGTRGFGGWSGGSSMQWPREQIAACLANGQELEDCGG